MGTPRYLIRLTRGDGRRRQRPGGRAYAFTPQFQNDLYRGPTRRPACQAIIDQAEGLKLRACMPFTPDPGGVHEIDPRQRGCKSKARLGPPPATFLHPRASAARSPAVNCSPTRPRSVYRAVLVNPGA